MSGIAHYKHQMNAGTTHGAVRMGMCRHTPAAHEMQGRAHGRSVGSCQSGHHRAVSAFVDLPLKTSRDFGVNRRRGLFPNSISRGYSLADQYRSRRHSVGNRPEQLPTHSEKSSAASLNALKPTHKRGQGRGEPIQELGQVIQGRAADD